MSDGVGANSERLDEVQQRLVEQWIDFARHHASRSIGGLEGAGRRRQEYDDALSDTFFALCRAALKFVPEKGYKFSTYANYAMQNALHSRHARQGRQARAATLPLTSTETGEELFACRCTSADDEERQERAVILGRLLELLCGRERMVLRLRYLHGLTYPQIGKLLGDKSSGWAQQVAARALVRLRKLATASDCI